MFRFIRRQRRGLGFKRLARLTHWRYDRLPGETEDSRPSLLHAASRQAVKSVSR